MSFRPTAGAAAGVVPREEAERGPRRGRRGWALWESLAALLLFAWAAWLGACALSHDRQDVADDAFITFTYARHWNEGLGMRFNADDAGTTAGCSTELHLWVAAGAMRLGVDPLVATRAVSLAAMLAAAAIFGGLAAFLARARPSAGLLAGAALAAAWVALPETRVHLASGMETWLFALVHALLFAWAAWVATRDRPVDLRVCAAGAAAFALVVTARPEGWLLVLAYAAAAAVARLPRAGLNGALRGAIPTLATAVAVVGAWFAWRLSTYGSILPNPYYVKSNNAIFGSDGAWLPGLSEVTRFAVLRLLPLAFLLLCAARLLLLEARAWVVALILFVPAALVLVLYTRAIHEMAGGFRYEFPIAMPLFAGLCACLAAVSLRSTRGFHALIAAAALVVPALASSVRPAWWDDLDHARSTASAWTRARAEDNALARAGRDLAEIELGDTARRPTILLSAAGQIPWYSRWRAIDWIGLNDNRLSGREALSVDDVWRYLEGEQPDVVQSILPPAAGDGARDDDANYRSANVQTTLRGRGSALFAHWNREIYARMLWREMSFLRERCVFGACYKLGDRWGEDWWVFLYVRADSPHRDAILAALAASKRADATSDLSRVFPFDPRALKR